MTYRDYDSIHPAVEHYPDVKTADEAYAELWAKHAWPGQRIHVQPMGETPHERAKRLKRELALLDPTEVQRRKSKEGQQRKLKRRIIVYMRDKWTCVECNTHLHDLPEGVRLTLDHIRPTSKGGSNEVENLQTMCSTCNEAKDNTWDGISGFARS